MSIGIWVDVIGWLGALSVLVAYFMVSLGKWDGKSSSYQGFNLFGGACLILNTIFYRAYPSSLVNLVWVGIAIYTLVSMRKRDQAPGK
jgi:formate hydrogenlyase subunit 3/multisubunit Na+/H+ antiporter MnhD subunit